MLISLFESNASNWLELTSAAPADASDPTIFDQMDAVSRQLLYMPDDPLDLATTYLREKAVKLATTLEHYAQLADASFAGDDLMARLPALQLRVDSIGTADSEEAWRVADMYESALDQRHALVGRVVREPKRPYDARARLTWSRSWPAAVRIVVLLALALGAWRFSELSAFRGPGIWLQLIVTVGLFAVLDLALVERVIEPLLAGCRRASLKRYTDFVSTTFKEAGRQVEIVYAASRRGK